MVSSFIPFWQTSRSTAYKCIMGFQEPTGFGRKRYTCYHRSPASLPLSLTLPLLHAFYTYSVQHIFNRNRQQYRYQFVPPRSAMACLCWREIAAYGSSPVEGWPVIRVRIAGQVFSGATVVESFSNSHPGGIFDWTYETVIFWWSNTVVTSWRNLPVLYLGSRA